MHVMLLAALSIISHEMGEGLLYPFFPFSWMNESIPLPLSSMETKDVYCISNGSASLSVSSSQQ